MTAKDQQRAAQRKTYQTSAASSAAAGDTSPGSSSLRYAFGGEKKDVMAALRGAQQYPRPPSTSSEVPAQREAGAAVAAFAAANAGLQRAMVVSTKRSPAPARSLQSGRAALRSRARPTPQEPRQPTSLADRERGSYYATVQSFLAPVFCAVSGEDGDRCADKPFLCRMHCTNSGAGVANSGAFALEHTPMCEGESRQHPRGCSAYEHGDPAQRGPPQQRPHFQQEPLRPQLQGQVGDVHRHPQTNKTFNQAVEKLLQMLVQSHPLPPVDIRREVLALSGGAAALKRELKLVFDRLRRMTAQKEKPATSRPPNPPPQPFLYLESSTCPYLLSSHTVWDKNDTPAYLKPESRQEDSKALQQRQRLKQQQQMHSQVLAQDNEHQQWQQQQWQRLQHAAHSIENEENVKNRQQQQQSRRRSDVEDDSKNFAAPLTLRQRSADTHLPTAAAPSFSGVALSHLSLATSLGLARLPVAPSGTTSPRTFLSRSFIHCPYSYSPVVSRIAPTPTCHAEHRAGDVADVSKVDAIQSNAAAGKGIALKISPPTVSSPETGAASAHHTAAVVPKKSPAGVLVCSARGDRQDVKHGKAAECHVGQKHHRQLPPSSKRIPARHHVAPMFSSRAQLEAHKQQPNWTRGGLQQSQRLRQDLGPQLRIKTEQHAGQPGRLKNLYRSSATGTAEGAPLFVGRTPVELGPVSLSGAPFFFPYGRSSPPTSSSHGRKPALPQPLQPQPRGFLRGSPMSAGFKDTGEKAAAAGVPFYAKAYHESWRLGGVVLPGNAGALTEEIIRGNATTMGAFPRWNAWQNTDAFTMEPFSDGSQAKDVGPS